MVDKVRKISKYVGAQGSALRMQSWLALWGRQLQLDCKTRWSSTQHMLEVALGLRDKIRAWRRGLEKAEDREKMHVSDEEWDNVEKVLDILKPFATATAKASERDQPLGYVLPVYNSLYYDLIKQTQDAKYQDFLPGMQKGMGVIEEYYGYCSRFLLAATMLDPRENFYFFEKYASCAGHDTVAAAQIKVRAELAPYLASLPPPAESEEQDPDDDIFGVPSPFVGDELALHQQEPKLRRKEDPLA